MILHQERQHNEYFYAARNIAIATVVVLLVGTLVAEDAKPPSDAELMAFKVYHHTIYKAVTSKQAKGTNRLLHTTELPTEGTDPVVTPALDHLYTKAIIGLKNGPVVLDLPVIPKERYFSIQIMDQEHYTI